MLQQPGTVLTNQILLCCAVLCCAWSPSLMYGNHGDSHFTHDFIGPFAAAHLVFPFMSVLGMDGQPCPLLDHLVLGPVFRHLRRAEVSLRCL